MHSENFVDWEQAMNKSSLLRHLKLHKCVGYSLYIIELFSATIHFVISVYAVSYQKLMILDLVNLDE